MPNLKNSQTLNKSLFWDVDPEKIDLNEHRRFIIERVINYGTLDNLKEILRIYGKQKIKKDVFHLKNLSNKSMNFVSFFFSIPKEQLTCYTKRLSSPEHWNY